MTAIYGLWHRDGQPGRDSERMGRSLAIYGAERQGLRQDGGIALGIGLSILTPEDRLDRQPLTGGNGRFMLVADMRLDNRGELAAMLAIPGTRAREMADADFALMAWERWREGALDRLIGDWAIAVWDAAEKTLTLARDFLGNRPLFYRAEKDRFAFASMAKGIHALPDVPIAPDFDTLRDQLVLLPARGPKSHFEGISRVEPGALVIAHAGGQVERREWYEWRLDRESHFADDGEAIDAFRSTFDRAVADRLRAIGSVACQLSGGFDSTAIAASAALQLGRKGKRLAAYTHVPLRGVPLEEREGRFSDEWPLASKLAARYPNIDHVAVEAADRTIGGDSDAECFYNERPMLNTCNGVWFNEISRTAVRAGHKVMLVGTSGNVTISQNGVERLPELLAAGHLRSWWREIRAYAGTGISWKHAIIGQSLLPLLPVPMSVWLRMLFRRTLTRPADYSPLRPEHYRNPAFRERLKQSRLYPVYSPMGNRRALAVFMHRSADSGAIFKGYFGASGLDFRAPAGDRRLVELCLSLPSEMFFRHGQKKWLYRQAFGDRIPPEIMNESRKGYQAADWLVRLQRDSAALRVYGETLLTAPGAAQLVDVEEIQRLLNNPLPAHADRQTRYRYRVILLRALSVGHFISKNTPHN